MKNKTGFCNMLGVLIVAATMAVTFAGSAQADHWHEPDHDNGRHSGWNHNDHNWHHDAHPVYRYKYDFWGYPVVYQPVYRPVYRPVVYYPQPVYYYPGDYYPTQTVFSFTIR